MLALSRDSVLHPFVVALGRAARLAADDPPEAQLEKLEAILAPSSIAETAPLFVTGASRSRRAANESCNVAGIAKGGNGPTRRQPCGPATSRPPSSTVLVNSSTKSGTPSVLATICAVTSGAAAGRRHARPGFRPPQGPGARCW
jgi:hypothetical protein